jgi:succinyl-CoA synthetase beta subunit
MYDLFQAKDLDLIEINPLGVNKKGELMALDGKITIHDSALARHPDIKAFKRHGDRNIDRQQVTSGIRWLDWKGEKGKVAIICNSYDLAVLTWDLIGQQGVKPACAVTIEDSLLKDASNLEAYGQQLQQILTQLESVKGLTVILVNIWTSKAVSSQIIEQIAVYCQLSTPEISKIQEDSHFVLNNSVKATTSNNLNKQQDASSVKSKSSVKFVLRLLHRGEKKNKNMGDTIYLTSSLKSAVSQTISLVKSR